MKINKAELIAIAVRKDQYPSSVVPEVAFAGRSNVGKSSLLNLLTGRKKLAHVSGTPGKTRTINFYEINGGEFRIVDLPGYGYARASKSAKSDWGTMIEKYLSSRDALKKVVLLVDIRHDPSAQDVQMYEWMKYYGYDGLVAATKADKVTKNEMPKKISAIRNVLGLGKDDIVVPVSALKKTGTKELMHEIERAL